MSQDNDTNGFDYTDLAPFIPFFVLFAVMEYMFDKLKFWNKKERITTASYEPATTVQYKKKRGYL
jgi:hypothetical protein